MPDTSPAAAAEQPSQGGSYTLDPATGALTRVQGTAPAAGTLRPAAEEQPATDTPAQEA